MFGFIKTAFNAVKQSIYNAYVTVKEAIKSAYTKTRNFFFGVPPVKQTEQIELTNSSRKGALANFIDPMTLQRPTVKPNTSLSSVRSATISSNKNGVPSPFSPAANRFSRPRQDLTAVEKPVPAAKLPDPSLNPFFEGPKAAAAAPAKKTYLNQEPFIPIVSSKDVLDAKTLKELDKKSPVIDVEAAPAVAPNTPMVAAQTPEQSILFAPITLTAHACDDLGAALDNLIKDGKPQEAFDSVMKSFSGLFWTAPKHEAKIPDYHADQNDGWGAEPKAKKNLKA